MIKHTIHYDTRNIRKAGWIAFADDLLKIMREYWNMKKALRKLKKYRAMQKLLVGFGESNTWEELEKKVRL